MQIVCPACETAYDVPGTALRPGRALRCARCRHQWVPVPDEPEMPATVEPVEPVPPPAPEYVAPLPIPRASQASVPQASYAVRAEVAAAWFLTALLLAAGIAESVYWRASIVKAWPPSERAYALLGYRQTP
jgi:predicted Zn finger-like uncharacterized protein